MLLCTFAQVVSVLRSLLSKLHSETPAVGKSTQLGYETNSFLILRDLMAKWETKQKT